MKTFNDLVFEPHPWCEGGRVAHMTFKNGYGVSVVCGLCFYSNGLNTFEVAVLKNGRICYDTHITKDVLGYLSADQVTNVMARVQRLASVEKVAKKDKVDAPTEEYAWAVYNFINRWKCGEFGEVSLKEALERDFDV